jgi:leucyl/phenylalanyl-tRNA--protein transferase
MIDTPRRGRWLFPALDTADPEGFLAVGADLEPETLLDAYRHGCFPMPLVGSAMVGWWSPDPRGILEPADLVVSRSLRRSLRRFEITVDRAFASVIRACADPARPGTWIDEAIIEAYCRLHRLGWAHSFEAWSDGQLVGGLYGVAIGAFFAGESMFSLASDASKVALVALVDAYADLPRSLIDVQWTTEHLAGLGAIDVERDLYVQRLEAAIEGPGPDWVALGNEPILGPGDLR